MKTKPSLNIPQNSPNGRSRKLEGLHIFFYFKYHYIVNMDRIAKIRSLRIKMKKISTVDCDG
jgi:hypothetical protein